MCGRRFCARSGPPQLGVVLVFFILDRDFIRLKKEMMEAMIVSSVFAFCVCVCVCVCVSVAQLQVTVFDLGTKYFG